MSDPALVAYSAEIAAIQAEVFGMVALNDYRKGLGQGIAYDDEPFFEASDKLKKISATIGELYSR